MRAGRRLIVRPPWGILAGMIFSFPDRINQIAARLVAAVVATTLLTAFVTKLWWLVAPLAVGFLLRVGWGPRFSPLARIAMAVAPRIAPVQSVAGPPKRFAQGVGALCTVSASALFLAGQAAAGWAIVGMVLVFATLEAGIGFCAGCFMYKLLQRAGVFPPEACPQCVAE